MVWDHVHQCGVCGHANRIDRIDLKVTAAGVIICPNREASGPINVKIMQEKMIPEPRPFSDRETETTSTTASLTEVRVYV